MVRDRLHAFSGLLRAGLGLAAAALPIAASAATTERSVYYSYDLVGRQLTAKFDSAAGADGVTNVYNGFGEVTSSTLTMGTFSKTLTSAYDGAGNRTQLTHPDGQAFTYSYDALGRLSGLYEGVGTATALDTFAYGSNGLVSSRSDDGGSSVSYGYDDIGRLTSQNDAFTGGSGNVARTLAFNPASGLTTETRDNDSYAFPTSQIGSVNRAYAVNGLNQYTSAGPASFTYDANGNLITDGTWTYTYDVENRLVHATGAGKDVTLIYDPLGRLFQLGGSGVGDVQFLYDGDALIADYVVSTGAMNDRFVHGSNAAADDPLVWYGGSAVGSGNRNLLHADHLGSIVARTSGGGATINSYDEYGIPATTNSGRFGYTGQAWLYEIGLDYYKARMYSPSLGRFLQTDPIGYEGGVNIYEYASDDPVDDEDPTGLADQGPPVDQGQPQCTGSHIASSCGDGGLAGGASGTSTASITGRIERAGGTALNWVKNNPGKTALGVGATVVGVACFASGVCDLAAVVGGAVEAAEAGEAAAGKSLLGKAMTDLFEQGFNPSRIRAIIGWGSRASGASARLETMDGAAAAAEARKAGMTRTMVRSLRDGYRDAAARGRGEGVAHLRVQILDRILEEW